MNKKIVIVGGGAAGIGLGIVLKKMGLDFLIIEQSLVGQSFKDWPTGTRFISPSFTGNYFGAPDLNAICPDTSPAYVLNTEHPSGKEYAIYLQNLVAFYELPVAEKTKVTSLHKEENFFKINTEKQEITADIVIWAGGEYQFPKTKVCEGSELAVHNTQISDLRALEGDQFPIIGGYESGFDTAIQLAKLGKKSIIFDSKNHLLVERSDSSHSISPYTKDRLLKNPGLITIKPYSRIKKIEYNDSHYVLTTEDGEIFNFQSQPILATGFKTSLETVKDFFYWENNSPKLTENDESTKVDGFYLVGPQVKHQKVIFCFIYKFRQRFAVVAEAVAKKFGLSENESVSRVLKEYQQKNFYLNDLSCCDNECVC